MRNGNIMTIVLAVAIMLIAAPVSAQVNVVWDGETSAVWGLNTNWVGDVAPTDIDDVEFNDVGLAGVGLTVDMNGASIEVNDMLISGGADGYDFIGSGGDLSVADFTHSATGTNTFSGDLYTTGAVNVNAGKLAITGDANGIGGAVNVNAGAILEARRFSLGVATIALNGGTASFSVSGGSILNSPLNYDFNTPGAAGLAGWNVIAGPGNNVVFAGDANPCSTQGPAEGANYIETHKGSDNNTGILRSDPFIIGDQGGGEQISLQVGGGAGSVPLVLMPDTPTATNWIGVTLEQYDSDADTWTVVAQAPHNFQWGHNTQIWDTSGYVGETMRMGIYDTGGGGWGFVTVDDIQISAVATLNIDTPGDLVMTDNAVTVTASSTLEAIVDAPSSASFGALTLTDGTLTIENLGTGTSFSAVAPIPSDAVTGIIAQKPVTLNGALSIGDRADVTLGAPLTITGGIVFNDDGDADSIAAATIRVPSGTTAWPGTFNQAGVATHLTQAGPGTLQLHDLGASAADQTEFTVKDAGTIEFSGATPLGGSENINIEGGTIRIEGEVVPGFDNGLIHYGYHTGPNGVMDLNNNGGMMGGGDPTLGATFYGESVLTSGPRDLGLYFDGDGNFTSTGSIGRGDNYSNMWLGYVSVDETGNWTFKSTQDDDRVGIWLDLDQDGVFESSTPGLGSDRGEQLMWEQNNTNKTVSLTAGEKYMVAFTHSEGTGGSKAAFQFQSPSLSMRNVNPGDAVQDGLWLHDILVANPINLPGTDVVVDAPGAAGSTLELNTTSTATLGNLTLNSGILTVDGADGGTTFNTVTVADAADTGLISTKPLGITSGGLTINNTTASGSQNFTFGGSYAVPGTLTLGNNAKVTVGAGSVTAQALSLEAGVATANTFVLGADGLLTAGAYDDGGQSRVISLQPDGAATTGKLCFGSAGAAGTVVANNTTFNVAAGATLEGMDSAGAPLGAAGAQMLNLDGGTALFSREGKVYMPDGLAAHFAADQGVTVDGGGVVQGWADQSGNGFDATPHIGTPTLVANAINGLPAVEFSTAGGNDALGVDHSLFAKEMYFVWRNSDLTLTHNALFGKQAGGRGSTYIFENNQQHFHSNQWPESVSKDGVALTGNYNMSPIDQYMLLKVVVNDNDTAAEPYYISGVDSNSRPADWFISEIMAFDSKLSAAEEIAVGAYLADKYNLATAYTGPAVGDPLAAGDLNMTNTPVTVNAASTLEAVTDGDANFGALVFSTATTLKTAGAKGTVNFAGTTLAEGVNEFNTAADTNPGAITVPGAVAAVILKTGSGDLVIDGGAPDLSGGGELWFQIQNGRLIGQADSVSFGEGQMDLNGGELVLLGTGPGSSLDFENACEVAGAGGIITAGMVGSGASGSTISIYDLAPSGGSLKLQTFDSNTLAFPDGLFGAGGVDVTIAGDVEVGAGFFVDTLIMSSGTIAPIGGLTSFTVDSGLSVSGCDLDLAAAGLTLNTTANTVVSVTNGKTLTLDQATLGAVNPLAGLEVDNSTMIGQVGNTTVTIGGTASLLNATLVRILLAGPGGVAVDTSPDPDGFVDLGAGPHTYSGDTVIHYGALAVDSPAALSVNSNLKLDANNAGAPAVLLTEGTFTRAIGAGAGQVQWSDNGGGFAAKGAGLDVNIGGAGAALTWATDLNGKTLQFGHGTATARVDFQNAIDLGGVERTVFVADNPSVDTDIAEMSGNLTNGTLKKTGAGTLDITGTSLTGTNIVNGAVRIADGSFANLGAIALIGSPTIDDGPGVTANPAIGVIETNRATPVVINATDSPDLDIAFTNSSVGASASDASGLMVSVGGLFGELEAAARARSITWSTDLNNKPIVMGSATAQGPVELLNPILIDSNTARTFFVADNPSITTDKAIVTIDSATTARDGLRKGGDGELVVKVKDTAGVDGTLDINGHEFEIDAGTLTLAAGSTMRFFGLNEQDTRIEAGATFLNQGTVIYDPNNGGQHEIRQRGAGTFRNEGVFSFSYDASTSGSNDTRYEWDNDPDSVPGGKFVQAVGGSITIKDGHNGIFRTENTNDIGSGVVVESGADITITGNRNLYFRRQVGLDMTAGGTLKTTNDGSAGGEIILENGTRFSADASTLLQADGAGSRIYIRNGDTNAVNPDGVALTMQGVNGGQVRIGGQWSNATAVLVGDAFIGENFLSGAAASQINFDVAATSVPGSLVWGRGSIYARNGHTLTIQNDVIFQNVQNSDVNLETQGTGQIVLASGATLTQNNNREIRITAATSGGDAIADFLNHGTVTWLTNGRIDTRDEAIFENAADGLIVSNNGAQANMGREGGGNAQIINKGQILADNSSSMWFREGGGGNDYLQVTDVGQAASGGAAIIEAKAGSTIGFQANMDFAADTLLKTSTGGRIELGGYIHGAALNGVIQGNVFIGEDLRIRQSAAEIDMNLTGASRPDWLEWNQGSIVIDGGKTLTTRDNIYYTSTSGDFQIQANGTGKFVVPTGVTLSHEGTKELRLYTNVDDDIADFVNEGTVTWSNNTRIALQNDFIFENTAGGQILVSNSSGQMGRRDNGRQVEVLNKGLIRAENGKALTFHDNGDTHYLLVTDVGSAASGGSAVIEADGGTITFNSNIDFAADTQLKAINGGRINLGGRIQGAELNGVVQGDVRIGTNLYTKESAVAIDLDLTNSATPGYLVWSGGSIYPQNGDTLTHVSNISFEGNNNSIVLNNTGAAGQFVTAHGSTFLLPTLKGGEIRSNGNNIHDDHPDWINHGTVQVENGRRINFQERFDFENATDGVIRSGDSGTGYFSRQNNDRNEVTNKGRVLADGGWLRFDSRDPNNNNYLLFTDVGQAASGGNAVIEATNYGGVAFGGNVNFAADTVFMTDVTGRIELGGAIQNGGIYGIAEGNVVIGEEVWTRGANDVIDVNVVNASTPGYLGWRESSLRPNSGEKLTLLTNIRYTGNQQNIDPNGTGQVVIAPGVTLLLPEGVGGELRVNGDNNTGTIDLVNHGTIRIENNRRLNFNTKGVLENASDGMITSGAGGTGRISRQNNDYNTLINKGLVRADGGNLVFESRNDANNYLLFQDVGQAASGGSAIIEGVNGGQAIFNGQVSFAPDTLFRGIGGQVELGGQPMTAELNGVAQGNVVFGETLRTKANLTINVDVSQAATPGYLVWEDGGRMEARGGFDITIDTNISYKGVQDDMVTWNQSQYFITEGTTFAIDRVDEVRLADGSNTNDAIPELTNAGTILFNPANFQGQGGRIEFYANYTRFLNDTTGLIRSTASSGGFYRENNERQSFDNLGTIEVESSSAHKAWLEIDRGPNNVNQAIDFVPYEITTKTLETGTYRVLAVDNDAELRIEGKSIDQGGWGGEIEKNGVDIIGAGAKVVLSENTAAVNALFRWVNTNGNVISTVNGELYVHGYASVDMASTVTGAGAVLGGDGSIDVAGGSTLTVSAGATLDPGVLDADNSSAGGTLTINGDVDMDVSAIKYAYKPGDKIDITGTLAHATPTHEIILSNGGASYASLGASTIIMSATGGAPTGAWTVSVDSEFAGNTATFSNDAGGLTWDTANWAKDSLTLGTASAAYVGNDLVLTLGTLAEGQTHSTLLATDDAVIDGGFAVTGPTAGSTVNSLSIADGNSLTIGAAGNLAVTEAVSLAGTLDTGAGTLGADAIDVAGTGQLDTTGAINANAINVADGGVVNANGAVSVTGGTIALAGTMDVGAATGARTIDVAATGQLNVNAGGTATAAIQLNVAGVADVAATGTLATNQMSVTGTLQGAGDVTVANALDLDGAASVGGTLTAKSVDVDAAGGLTVLATGDLDVGRLTLADGATVSIDNTLAQNVVRYELDNTTLTHDIADAAGATYAGATSVIASGGTVVLGGTNTYTGKTEITGAVLETGSVSPDSLLVLNDGVLQVTGGATVARIVGTGAGELTWEGAGGFSARGGDATVDLSDSGTVLWRTGMLGQALLLSSSTADSKVTVEGNIDLSNQDATREVRVSDGSAAIDAELAGDISGGQDGAKLSKQGAGTLKMTGANTYLSDTEVIAGTLLVDDNSNLGDASSKLILHGGATLSGISWTSGVRTVELIAGSAVTIDAQAGSTDMALELEALAVTSANVVKTGAGTASLSNGVAVLGQVDVTEGTLEVGDNLLASPGGVVNVAAGATLQAGGMVSREINGSGTLEAAGDMVVGSYATGFDFGGLVKTGNHNVLAVDPDSANISSVSMAGGMLTSGNIIQIPDNPTVDYSEGAAGNVLVNGAGNVIGGVLRGGTQSGETATISSSDFIPANNFLNVSVRRGNWSSVGVTVTVDFDDQGFSPVFSADQSLVVNGSKSFVLTSDQAWTPVSDSQLQVVDGSGEYSQQLIFGTNYAPGSGVFNDADLIVTAEGGFEAEAGDEFFLVRTDGDSWGTSAPFTYNSNVDLTGTIDSMTIDVPISGDGSWEWNSTTWMDDEFVKIWVTGVVVSHPGDANNDGAVDAADLAIFNSQLGQRGPGLSCDFFPDEKIDMNDFAIMRGEWGWTAPPAPEAPATGTPEPATISLLAIGGILVLRRRRRKA